jgi:hypothetical protein
MALIDPGREQGITLQWSSPDNVSPKSLCEIAEIGGREHHL